MRPIYLDHNATTPIDPQVLEAMLPFLQTEFGNPSSNHPYGRAVREAIESARDSVAKLIGASSEEIVFTSGGTEASQLGLLGVAGARRRDRHGKPLRIVSFALEHPATLRPLDRLRQMGDEIVLIDPDPDGVVRVEAMIEAIQAGRSPDLVSLMHAHNETGAIQPVAEIGRAVAERGGVFHVDAAQSLGKLNVDVDTIGCHLLSIAGHKIYAPKGIGALYLHKGVEIDSMIPGAGQERGLRGGTPNVPGIIALGAACRIASRHVAANDAARLAALRDRLWERLRSAIPGIRRTSEPVPTLPNTLHIRFPGVTGNAILASSPGVAASTGSACHAGSEAPPGAIVALGVEEREALGSIRLSLGHGNDADTIERAAEILIRGWRSAKGGNPDATQR